MTQKSEEFNPFERRYIQPQGPMDAIELSRVVHDQVLYPACGVTLVSTNEYERPTHKRIADPLETVAFSGEHATLKQDLLSLVRTPGKGLFGIVRMSIEREGDGFSRSVVAISEVPRQARFAPEGPFLPSAPMSQAFSESCPSTFSVKDPTVDAYGNPIPYWQVGMTYDPWNKSLTVQQFGGGAHLNTLVALPGFEAPEQGTFGAAWATDHVSAFACIQRAFNFSTQESTVA